ncbi:hypothetical protein PVAP13_2NG409003 [Panicum virgatum]|uniref:Endonuclease/exonuclease/phosphatase domain-containing protein n=1 Tax=Panicum virgatum TaxID=38727 RepID=A0A8T0VRV2_PANVG|nr:hypothetical protein PVAP13_2NG409003 [Panicum virgatum]
MQDRRSPLRGDLASARAVRALLEIQRREKPEVFFLSETHLDKATAEKLKRSSGGLLLIWKKEVSVQCQGVSRYYVDVTKEEEEEWRLTVIYGEPRWEHKHLTYEAMRSLHSGSDLPWLMLGDFNEILFHREKEGGRARSQAQLQAFQNSLMDCGLVDIGFIGDNFTWQRGWIRERLDRGVANTQWNLLFPSAQLKNGEMVKSDHRPLVVETDGT